MITAIRRASSKLDTAGFVVAGRDAKTHNRYLSNKIAQIGSAKAVLR
jgi:hypothetical protein